MTTQTVPRPSGQSHGRLDRTLGITERIAPKMKAWTGELRVRLYTDFQVNEIATDGTVLHLKDTRLADQPNPPLDSSQTGDSYRPSLPEPKDAASSQPPGDVKPEAKANGQAADQQKEEPPEVSPEDMQTLADLTSESFTQDVLAIYRAAATKQPIPVPARTTPIEDKDQRAKIHHNVRRIFRSLVDTTADTSATTPGGAAIIVAAGRPPRPPKAHNPQQNRSSSRNNKTRRGKGAGKVNAEGEGDYLHFTIYKENRDTMDTARQLARCLYLKPQIFVFAGTKDRRAATTQRCSVRGVKAETVAGAYTRLHGVWTGDYRYASTGLHLGALQGNEFVITLKNCRLVPDDDEDDDEDDKLTPADRQEAIRACATSALASMASRGWIHYYGHQRFGTHAIGTHEVGQRILNSDYESAVAAILAYDDHAAQRACDCDNDNDNDGRDLPAEAHVRDELNRARACRAFQRDGASAEEALRFLPRRFAAEAAVIRHLGRHTRGAAPGASRRDFQGALLCIPRPLRNMYLHAYQSLVWNHAASRRWAVYRDTVVAGDLVLDDSNTAAVQADEITSEPDADNPTTTTARALTAEEAASGRYTIHDIVLPSPGHNVIYPTNDIGAFYAAFMRRPENGALDPHDMRRRHREFSLPGHYRHLTTRFLPSAAEEGQTLTPTPTLPRVEVRRYADDEEQMHPTDLDRVRAARKAQAEEAAVARKRKWQDERDQSDGKEEGGEKPEDVEAGRQSKKAKAGGHGDGHDDGDGDGDAHNGEPTPAADAMQVDHEGGSTNKTGESASSVSTKPAHVKQVPGEEKAKDKVAVIVHFRLTKSAYATVALRELMGFSDHDAADTKPELTSSTG
ncbi:tRNA pseudouridine synthase D [Sodiomyces alkalinus F11]|uniref:tRNA pseudouridine synthase D n=1 Tax=Sodiomyces alkalinus (strain CBS 110278 / VKM F-3762 / F11) TaxID=1314773 RepID=A0A3N2PND0_SODAK|nr:tRNA pseudouridine synthase D [Sodiomyces alkalinus F11]ROT36037.1 tRNA pseudouridine synthase D [Sodiomyces alkalinus F11]